MSDTGNHDDAPRPNRGLGRGLSALLGETTTNDAETIQRARNNALPIERLRPGRFQPRRRFDDEEMRSLVESVRRQGILQPIVVRPIKGEQDLWEIVAGERRWRAAQTVQLHDVPVIIKDLNDSDTLQIALIENIQRQDLNAIEEAEGYRRLSEDFGHTQGEIAEAVGKSRSHVSNVSRLLSLPDEVTEMVRNGQLSAGHARSIIGSDDPVGLARKMLAEGMNVRQAEAIRKGVTKAAADPKVAPVKDADTQALENSLRDALGLLVDIKHKNSGMGEVLVKYQNLEQLDDICQRLLGHTRL